MIRALFSLLALAFSLSFVSEAQAAHIVAPKWKGYALDWCANFEVGCGQPAADLYCQKLGYPKSTAFQIQQSVPYATLTVGQNAICNPAVHHCDSFAYIDCQETTKTFLAPKLLGYRVDWCREFEVNCGAPAAQAFCQAKGYASMVNFGKQPQLSVQTLTVNTHAVCDPNVHLCDGFSYIECKK